MFFCVSVSAISPTVDFDWYQSGDKNSTVRTIFQTIFDPSITTDSNLSLIAWGFGTDGNVNIVQDNSIQRTMFFDNFDDADLDGWVNTGGSWTEASGYVRGGGVTDGASLYHPLDQNLLDGNMWINFRIWLENADATNAHVVWLTHDTEGQGQGAGNILDDGYNVRFNNTTGKLFRRNTEILNFGAGLSDGSWHDINIFHQVDGNINVFIDGTSGGSVIDTTYNDGNTVIFSADNTTNLNRWNDLNIVQEEQIPIDQNQVYSFSDANIQNVCLTVENNTGSTTTCHEVTIIQNTDANVSIEQFSLNATTGFDIGDLNAHFILRCLTDLNTTADLNYTATLNGVTVYSALNDNNGTAYASVSPNSGDNTGTFSCFFNSLNSDSNTTTFTLYSATFTLVDEETGTAWNTADYNQHFTDLAAKSYETGSIHNFISEADNSFSVSSLVDDTIRLDINMTNGLEFFKEFTLSVLAPDTSIEACLATKQSIFEQVFVSSQSDTRVVLNHGITDCYALAAHTSNAYENNFAARAFTISDPYTLYYFDGDTKIVLSNLDGGTALEHNLQVLALNKTTYEIDIASDFLSVSPVFNAITGENDANKLQIYYRSLRNTNTALDLRVYLDSAIIWSHYETDTPNDLLLTFDYTDLNLTDQNLLKLIAESTTADETNTKTIYFTIATVGYGNVLPPILAAIIAILLVLFGLTLVTTQFGFGWFGLIIILLSIAVITLAPGVWWILYLQGILLIILAFIGFVYKNETSRVN